MSTLRVAYVLRVFPKLSETFIAGELAELRRRGVELLILSQLPPREELRHRLVGEAGLDAVTVYEPERFAGALRAHRPHLLHAHFATEATAQARDLAAAAGLPFTFTAHSYDIYRKPPADIAARAAAAAAVVTVSEANRAFMAASLGIPAERVSVIPCGVDLDVFSPNGGPVKPLVVCVARLNPAKRLEVLLAACALLRDRGVRFRCAVVGEGRCRDELERTHAELRLDGVVELVGAAPQHEVREWWRRASVATLSSVREGAPVALMEAAACGVPAVAPAVGGVAELIDDGRTGFVTRPGDPVGLADGLERLLTDDGLRRRLGAAARRRAEERFSVTTQVDRLLELWEGVLGA